MAVSEVHNTSDKRGRARMTSSSTKTPPQKFMAKNMLQTPQGVAKNETAAKSGAALMNDFSS